MSMQRLEPMQRLELECHTTGPAKANALVRCPWGLERAAVHGQGASKTPANRLATSEPNPGDGALRDTRHPSRQTGRGPCNYIIAIWLHGVGSRFDAVYSFGLLSPKRGLLRPGQ